MILELSLSSLLCFVISGFKVSYEGLLWYLVYRRGKEGKEGFSFVLINNYEWEVIFNNLFKEEVPKSLIMILIRGRLIKELLL
jgi:hypothetical protein